MKPGRSWVHNLALLVPAHAAWLQHVTSLQALDGRLRCRSLCRRAFLDHTKTTYLITAFHKRWIPLDNDYAFQERTH